MLQPPGASILDDFPVLDAILNISNLLSITFMGQFFLFSGVIQSIQSYPTLLNEEATHHMTFQSSICLRRRPTFIFDSN